MQDYAISDIPVLPLKVIISGGFGAGKTTFVGAISEIKPVRTEEELTQASAGTDHLHGVERKTATTVALDFGRITLNVPPLSVQLQLFGTPGQDRFWFMWDDLALGSIGAIVLADTRRLEDCFAAVEYYERRGQPFIVAVNEFDGAHRYTEQEIRAAIRLRKHVPLVSCDARLRASAKQVLIALVHHAREQALTTPAPAPIPQTQDA
ncbi:ATP/GTP-binding protein [Streptomyces sp. BV129]|uniref:GTP-binding protein n=1 Tax=Streptomyces sp. BV129 TaxID=2849671 RepID=UPI001C2F0716|nr:ATP/GTP-binding protein [Streptomyces sp. BV129]MBV1949116.1 ATP/GTP-binding protein [Streptomyces sp. BV129]